MSKLTPPSRKNLTRRLKFFLENLDYPNAQWEVFNITNLMIVRDFEQKKISHIQMINKLRELEHTQGLPQTDREIIIKSKNED